MRKLFHERNTEKGTKKVLLGGQPVCPFVNDISCSCLLEFTVRFNKLSGKTNKPHKIPKQQPPQLQKSLAVGEALH